MNNLSVLDGDDRDEPVVIGRTIRKNRSVHFVLENHHATILGPMHNQCVAGVKRDSLSVSLEASYQVGSPSNRHRLTWEVITGLEDCIFFSEHIKIVFTVNELA